MCVNLGVGLQEFDTVTRCVQVDYRERAAAAGRIPQNFLRRELAATANETLVSRAIGGCGHNRDTGPLLHCRLCVCVMCGVVLGRRSICETSVS